MVKNSFPDKLGHAKAPFPDREGQYVSLVFREVPQMKSPLQEGQDLVINVGSPGVTHRTWENASSSSSSSSRAVADKSGGQAPWEKVLTKSEKLYKVRRYPRASGLLRACVSRPRLEVSVLVLTRTCLVAAVTGTSGRGVKISWTSTAF
eukprot:2603454-Amphidinium_carterae.1